MLSLLSLLHLIAIFFLPSFFWSVEAHGGSRHKHCKPYQSWSTPVSLSSSVQTSSKPVYTSYSSVNITKTLSHETYSVSGTLNSSTLFTSTISKASTSRSASVPHYGTTDLTYSSSSSTFTSTSISTVLQPTSITTTVEPTATKSTSTVTTISSPVYSTSSVATYASLTSSSIQSGLSSTTYVSSTTTATSISSETYTTSPASESYTTYLPTETSVTSVSVSTTTTYVPTETSLTSVSASTTTTYVTSETSTTYMPTETSVTSVSASTTTTSVASETYTTPTTSAPAEFTPVNEQAYSGRNYKDSDHFRVYASPTDPIDETLSMLEGQYDCFVNRLRWRTSGLSNYDTNEAGPYYKTNIVSVESLGGSAGVQSTDYNIGVAYVQVVEQYLSSYGITCHEFGHALHYHQKTWVGQARTGAWWETVANWFADTYETSDLCSASREAVGRQGGSSMINVYKVIGDSFQVIVDGSVGSGNYYQAWPFLTYITNNPDGYAGLGSDVVRQLMLQYSTGSNEDPLHTLARVAGVPVSTIVGRYWARMAYVDIGNVAAQKTFNDHRANLNYVNVQQQGQDSYQVLESRQPRYMGANIIPLNSTGSTTLQLDIVAGGNYTATLAILDQDVGTVRYLDLVNGAGSADLQPREEATLVIANTPQELILYDGFALSDDVQQGLSYTFTLTGATVSSVAIAPPS